MNPTLSAWIDAYGEAQAADGMAPATIAHRSYSLGLFAAWCRNHGITLGVEVTRPVVLRFQRHLALHRRADGAAYGLHAQHSILTDLRAFGRWLTQAGIVSASPTGAIELPKLGTRLPPSILDREAIALLRTQPDIATPLGLRDRAILEAVYAVGLSGREVAVLRLEHYERTTALLRVPPQSRGRERRCPLGVRAAWWVDAYLREAHPTLTARPDADPGALFVSQWGRALEAGDPTHIVKRHLRSANLPTTGGIRALTHATAVHLIEAGCDLRFLAALFGHADLQSVRRYAQVSIRHLKAVHARFHPAEQEATP